MARLRHTTGLRSTNPMHGVFRAVKPRIGNRCTASGDLCIRISGINRVLFSYCFRQFLCFRSDTHCFDCWRLVRDFTVTASLTVYNGNFNAIRHEGSKVARNCMDASAIFIINTRNLNPNFSGCRNRIFDFDIPALDLTSFEWTYVLPYARINFPFILPSICLKDTGKIKLIREATCEGHISCCLRRFTITFDFTGHKMAKTRILSKWLTKLTHLCCVLSSFSKFCGFRLSFMITVDAWLILSAKMSCTSNISGKTKTQLVWRNELLTCPTQYKMETIAMYVDNID